MAEHMALDAVLEQIKMECGEEAAVKIAAELARMQSMEAYCVSPFDNPPELKARGARLVRALDMAETEKERTEIMEQLFGTCHPLVFPASGFRCDYGFNIHFKGLAVINYNVVMLDTSPIRIGEEAFLGPGVCLACAGHGIHPSQRSALLTSSPIVLEDRVWLGANVTVNGGVTIGEGSIIGAGSVVLKDIPKGVIAAGVPCRVIREITEEDRRADFA